MTLLLHCASLQVEDAGGSRVDVRTGAVVGCVRHQLLPNLLRVVGMAVLVDGAAVPIRLEQNSNILRRSNHFPAKNLSITCGIQREIMQLLSANNAGSEVVENS